MVLSPQPAPEASDTPRPRSVRRRSPVLATLVTLALVAVLAVLGGLALRISRWWNGPAAVPDHATTFSGSRPMPFAVAVGLTQRVRPPLDGFTAVDLVVAAENAGLPGVVRLQIQDYPSGRVLRTAQVPAARAPAGSVWDVRPGAPREQ